MNLPYSTNRENRGGTGFTLIELLVVIAIIGIITAIVLVILAGTRGEARDAVRMNDLRQLQNILERYQFDKDIYPLSTENYQIENHPWGSYWEGYGGVPKDPLGSQSYAYYSDGSFYHAYAKFEKEPVHPYFACAEPCGPGGEYNGGIASSGASLTAFDGAPPQEDGEEEENGGGGMLPPAEEGEQIFCDPPLAEGEQMYAVSTRDNPRITEVVLNPLDVNKFAWQEVTVKVRDTDEKPITEVSGEAQTDGMIFSFSLSLTEGTETDGTWQGSWYNEDEYCQNYGLDIIAVGESGTSKIELRFR